MAGTFFDYLIGNAADQIGTFFNAPELGWSEDKAGSTTANSGRVPVAQGVGITTRGQRIAQDAYNKNTGRLENMSFNSLGINNNNGGIGFGPSASDLGGSVNGISTIPSASSGGGSGYSTSFLNSLMDTASSGIQQGYQSTMDILNNNAGYLQQQSQGLIGQTDKSYGNQMQGLEFQRDQANKQLDQSQQDINSNRQDALSDLTSDLRQQMDSFTRYLGAMGASDSSAAGMGQYAFGRMGQQARSQIWKEANRLSSEVGQRRETVLSTFNENLRQLNAWKEETLGSIRMDLQDKMQQLNQAKMQADGNRLQQLNQLQQQIMQQAMTSALSVDQRLATLAQSNKQWAEQQTKTLSTIGSQIEQSLQQMNFGAMDGTGMNTQVANPFAFSAGDIQSGAGQNPAMTQIALPTNRKDDQL